jgi:phytoene dehydrogenase-like protein
MRTRRSASFHILVIGDDLGSLAYAALAARAGYRVGVLGQGTPRGTYESQGHIFPREPQRTIGFQTSPAVNAVFRDLAMGLEMRNLPRPAETILQYVRSDSRMDMPREYERWMVELERELKDGGRTLRHFESWAAQVSRETDGLIASEMVLPTVGFRALSRYERALGEQRSLIEGRAPGGVAPLDSTRDGGATRALVLGALAHMTTLSSQPLSPLMTGRLWTQLKAGITSVPGGVDALRGIFIEKIKEQCGSYRESAKVARVEIKRGRATDVLLEEREEVLGCELLVSGMEPEAFFQLLGGDMRRDKFQQAVAGREPSAWRLTVNLAVDPRVIPVGMESEVLLISSESGPLDGADNLWISRPGSSLAPGAVAYDGHPGRGVLSVTALMPARGLSLRPDSVRDLVDAVVDRLRGLIPWLDDHLELVDCPALKRDPNTGEDTLDRSALVPIYDRALERTLGVGEYDGRTSYKNVLLCGRGRFGGLSFEGDCMAAMQTLVLTRERAPLKSGLR